MDEITGQQRDEMLSNLENIQRKLEEELEAEERLAARPHEVDINAEELELRRPGPVKVASFGAQNYLTHLMPQETITSRELLNQFERELKIILDEVWDVYEAKGALYDQATPVWHHFPFGLTSFATLVYLKATRFVSLLQRREETPLSEIDDTLRDVLVYAWYAWAYARLSAQQGDD